MYGSIYKSNIEMASGDKLKPFIDMLQRNKQSIAEIHIGH